MPVMKLLMDCITSLTFSRTAATAGATSSSHRAPAVASHARSSQLRWLGSSGRGSTETWAPSLCTFDASLSPRAASPEARSLSATMPVCASSACVSLPCSLATVSRSAWANCCCSVLRDVSSAAVSRAARLCVSAASASLMYWPTTPMASATAMRCSRIDTRACGLKGTGDGGSATSSPGSLGTPCALMV